MYKYHLLTALSKINKENLQINLAEGTTQKCQTAREENKQAGLVFYIYIILRELICHIKEKSKE